MQFVGSMKAKGVLDFLQDEVFTRVDGKWELVRDDQSCNVHLGYCTILFLWLTCSYLSHTIMTYECVHNIYVYGNEFIS